MPGNGKMIQPVLQPLHPGQRRVDLGRIEGPGRGRGAVIKISVRMMGLGGQAVRQQKNGGQVFRREFRTGIRTRGLPEQIPYWNLGQVGLPGQQDWLYPGIGFIDVGLIGPVHRMPTHPIAPVTGFQMVLGGGKRHEAEILTKNIGFRI